VVLTKRKQPLSSKLYMIYIFCNNVGHFATKTFCTLHYTSLHFTTLHYTLPNYTSKYFFRTLVVIFWAAIVTCIIFHFMRSAPFWGNFVQCRMVVSFRRFGIRVNQTKNLAAGLLEEGRTGCADMPIRIYHSKLRKIP
jgi:hypothetical protein